MSRTRNYHQETLDVISRFYEVLDDLVKSKIITINGFCVDNKIDKRHLYAQKKDPSRGYFEIYWIVVLVKKYKVNSKFLLLGTGEMYVKRKLINVKVK